MSRKPFVREVSKSAWWLTQGRYLRYMMREVTCILIGAYTAMIIVGLMRLSEGPAAYDGFLGALMGPAGTAFHLVAFLFALYHTTTWFNVTPKAMPIQLGGKHLPDVAIVGAHYAGWAVVSVLILFLAGV